jgi:hypothetical protein
VAEIFHQQRRLWVRLQHRIAAWKMVRRRAQAAGITTAE